MSGRPVRSDPSRSSPVTWSEGEPQDLNRFDGGFRRVPGAIADGHGAAATCSAWSERRATRSSAEGTGAGGALLTDRLGRSGGRSCRSSRSTGRPRPTTAPAKGEPTVSGRGRPIRHPRSRATSPGCRRSGDRPPATQPGSRHTRPGPGASQAMMLALTSPRVSWPALTPARRWEAPRPVRPVRLRTHPATGPAHRRRCHQHPVPPLPHWQRPRTPANRRRPLVQLRGRIGEVGQQRTRGDSVS